MTQSTLSGSRYMNVKLTNVSIQDARLDGMTINGILVSDLMRAWRERRKPHTNADDDNSGATGSNAVFHVSNLAKSLDFYTRVLGFKIDFTFGEPESYAGLSLNNLRLHLSSAYPHKNNTGHGNLYIDCGQIDQLYERLDAAGADFYSRIGDRDYGMRDFAVKDPDGNQIGFGAPGAPHLYQQSPQE